MEMMQGLHTHVYARRKELGLRQADLARIARVSLPTLQTFEQGSIRELGFNKLARILQAVGLELRVHEANRGRPTLDDLRNEPEDETGSGLEDGPDYASDSELQGRAARRR